ncbi:hypothetical protein EsHS_00006928 [Epichloe bromicola]
MPRQKQPGAPEPKRRSRKGCWYVTRSPVPETSTVTVKIDNYIKGHAKLASCLKTGAVCDYSVRLNWEGRRTKRSVPDDFAFGCPTLTTKRIQWHHHEFGTRNGQISELTVKPNRGLDVSSSLRHELKQVQSTTSASSAEQEEVPLPAHANHEKQHTGNTSVFIDESQQPHLGSTKPEGYAAKRRLATSNRTNPGKSSHKSSQLNSPAIRIRRKRNKSFSELTMSNVGSRRLSTCSTDRPGTGSSTTWVSCPSTADGPLTPAASSQSDDVDHRSTRIDSQSSGSPDSCLSRNGGVEESPTQSGWLREELGAYRFQDPLSNSNVYPYGTGALYGFDVGRADEDLLQNNNDDAPLLPPAAYSFAQGIVEFGEEALSRHRHGAAAAVNGRYYEYVVPVIIPWAFEPLPDVPGSPPPCRHQSAEKMYRNHGTGQRRPYESATGVLRYDYPPGAKALPASRHGHRTLTEKASHRSQLLRSTLPQMRMAEWAQSIFPALRGSLVNGSAPVSDVVLAMAVMLVALEIMSPGAFGQGVSWRVHIAHAKTLLLKRLNHANEEPSRHSSNEGLWFIRSWLGYMDVMGSLMTGPRHDSVCKPHACFAIPEPSECDGNPDEIDCMTGVSAKCARLLGRVAELSKQCQGERFGLGGQLLQGWSPQAAVAEQALAIERQLLESLRQSSRPCSHVRAGSIHMRDLAEMAAINEAFHWAGLIHLHRRILGSRADHPEVQAHVRNIVMCLDRLRVGAAAELRCLFPIFTAGCEAIDEKQQIRLLSKLMSAERSGMKQTYYARLLLERVWEEGRSWEEVIGNEFIA